MNISRYLYRRQFILTPKKINEFENWKKVKLNEEYYLTIHPDLEVTNINKGQVALILLGYVLDPIETNKSNYDILFGIMNKILNEIEFKDELNRFGGRYVLVIKKENNIIILNDTTGFREIYYCQDRNKKTWCASQSSILAKMLEFSIDKEIDSDLKKTYIFKKGNEYWYPGNITPYREIKHLSPNHYYDLRQQKEVRFWPNKKISEIKTDKCVDEVSNLFKGLYKSAVNRFNLAQSITAGLDSRILLAASKGVSDKIYFFTHTHRNLTMKGNDIIIPSKLLKILGIDHHIMQYSENIDTNFEKTFNKNITNGRKYKKINTYTIKCHIEKLEKEYVVVNGYCGEITRNFFYLPKIIKLNGKILAAMTGMKGSKIAEQQFERWINENIKIEEYGINLLDLFYWEQRLGNWASMSCSENDIGFDTFSPFNCRRILEMMLGVRKKMRDPPNYKLHKKIIKNLWPEVMSVPINPSKNLYEEILKNIKRKKLHKIYKLIKYLIIK